jgi:hypothetical protein
METPGGATVFASVNGIHIEQPSEAQRKVVHKRESAVQLPGEVETKILQGVEDDSEDEAKRRERSIFKRKKTKGPNPLSIKKKTIKKETSSGVGTDEKGREKKKRQRRRSDNKTSAGAGGGGD